MAHLTDAIKDMVTEQLSDRKQYVNEISHAVMHIRDAKEWTAGAVNFANPAQRKELRRIRKDLEKLKNRLVTIKTQP
jgi:hypothetical protein